MCVGNLTVGGTGKTPFAVALARASRDGGFAPMFLTRGHGGYEAGPLRVDPDRHDAASVGDEALLLAQVAPTVMARDRVAGARLLETAVVAGERPILIMDDGLQNPSLAQDLALALVDGETGVGNGFSLPAGPLRASLVAQRSRTDACVVVGPGARGLAVAESLGLPWFRVRLAAPETAWLDGSRVVAFAGIGRPEKFFTTLRAAGADLRRAVAMPDHVNPSEGTATRLLAAAEAENALLVTTQKDLVRLRGARRQRPALAILCERAKSVPVEMRPSHGEATTNMDVFRWALERIRKVERI